MKKTPNRKLRLSIWCIVVVLLVLANVFATSYAFTWERALTSYFGTIGGKKGSGVEITMTEEELLEAQKALELEIVSEGTVLLKNDENVLPLQKGNKVSVFGQTAQIWMTKEKITGTKDTVFLESLQDAGLEINTELRKFYKQSKHTAWGIGANLGNGGIAGTWAIDEVPISEYTDTVKASYKDYSDAAIVVLSRGGSEGGDLPRHMGRFGGDDAKGYLELTAEERDLLTEVTANFSKVIVVLHTTNAMQMDFMNDYDIDAVLWVSGTGKDGVQVLGKLLTGEINPSGRNVDTYVYDNFSAPAMQNFSDFRFTKNGELIDSTTSGVGGTYSYMNYAEGIYVGYKYYETRYEDAVLGQGNAGDYNYDGTVFAPFGFGLSYTAFDWSDFTASDPDENGNISVSVKVTNSGSIAGKDVVELYYQAPYTQYDIDNRVEKASVNLADFAKTKLLAPGESEALTLTLNVSDMKSYDSFGNGTYILEAGDYYLTLAKDAHSAVNNILAAKGAAVDGDAALVATHTEKETRLLDTAVTGEKIENLFDHAYLSDAVYLSRSDWSVMENDGLRYATDTMSGKSETTDANGTVYTHEIPENVYQGLLSEGWDAAGAPIGRDDASWSAVTYGAKNGLTLADVAGLDYNDEQWDKLLDQLSQNETAALAGQAGWGSGAVDSVGKPETHFLDGPQGMIDYVSGGEGYQFTDENLLGATWNKELAYEFGRLVSTEFAMKGAVHWWAPAVNIHRTSYSARNFEYYSEDGVMNGLMATETVKAARTNGVQPTLKHFAFNDQDTNRGANGRLGTYATEQCLREIYLKAFELPVVNGKASSIMSSMGRTGYRICPGDWSLNTGVLRNEWGFTGGIITDAQSLNEKEAEQAIAAGCDMVCSMAQTSYSAETLSSKGGQAGLRAAAKNQLYLAANSIAVGMGGSAGFPVWKLLLGALYLMELIFVAYGTMEVLLGCYPEQKKLSKRTVWIIRIVVWAIAAALLGYLIFMLITEWGPALAFALQTAV